MLNTFVIKCDKFDEIMKWVIQLYVKLYPWCVQPPNWWYKGHIGNIYERIMAYSISQFSDNTKMISIHHGAPGLKEQCY